MPRFVTALYDESREADRAIEALKDNGFKAPDIQKIGSRRVSEGFFDRLFLNENGGGPVDEDVSVMGISPEDVDDYSHRIERGGALVILMCDEARIEEAARIFRRYDVDRVVTPEAQAAEKSKKKRGAVQPGRAEESKKWFHVVDIDEEDTAEGAKSHAVHVHARSDVDHQKSEEMPGAHPSIPLERFEREFRVHYEENFADSRYSFDDYKMAYRYGMALGENPRLRTADWSKLETHARRGWEDHDPRPWHLFAEAVRFGWRTIRRHHRRERRR